MKNLSDIIAENVKFYRSQTGLSQLKFSLKLEMAPSYLAEIETGKQLPSLKTVERLAKEFNIDPYKLLYPREKIVENQASNSDYKQALISMKEQINSIIDTQINKK